MSFMFCTVNGCDCQLIIKENYDDDDDVCLSVHLSVCLSVCQMITLESLDTGSS